MYTYQSVSGRRAVFILVTLTPLTVIGVGYGLLTHGQSLPKVKRERDVSKPVRYEPRVPIDNSGYSVVGPSIKPWSNQATLDEVAASWRGAGGRLIAQIDQGLVRSSENDRAMASLRLLKSSALQYEGKAIEAYQVLEQARASLKGETARKMLFTIIYSQGVAALRRGENDNCVMCLGESACILPISKAAVHLNKTGSKTAIRHFTEYLEQFPDDLEVRWLLNIAHMTLGEYPGKVDPKFLLSLDRYVNSEFNIGKFQNVAHLVGVNRLNQAGGSIMDDFDNDGRLDIVATTFDSTGPMVFYHNKGDGTFEDRTVSAGLTGQLGGLVCYQADFNNDGLMDIFIPRGAWLKQPIRPSLLRNDGGSFTDVTEQAKLLEPLNSNAACWADYDNDGFVDLFVACEQQTGKLYHNRRDGTFEEVASRAGLVNHGPIFSKGANWIDFDNDGAPDLFINHLGGFAELFHNERDGTFSEVTIPMGIQGPNHGFSCWAWDYDNDGWLDIFATCYDRTLGEVVKGLIGQPHSLGMSRLFRNVQGKKFEDVTKEAGLDQVYAAMGSNFADLDNDGFLDFYLGTGEPSLATLVPNRMFKNVEGKRFAEITGSSGTGHLQKGHGVAIGDWDRDGDVDLFLEMGGATNGDMYHNVLFQNPGQGNHWLTVKLVGQKTNRAAIGARIKVVTAGESPMTLHRLVSSGSSFGANPMEQTLGLAKATKLATLEITWPTSQTTQVFHDIPAYQSIEIVEFAKEYRSLDAHPIPLPRAED